MLSTLLSAGVQAQIIRTGLNATEVKWMLFFAFSAFVTALVFAFPLDVFYLLTLE